MQLSRNDITSSAKSCLLFVIASLISGLLLCGVVTSAKLKVLGFRVRHIYSEKCKVFLGGKPVSSSFYVLNFLLPSFYISVTEITFQGSKYRYMYILSKALKRSTSAANERPLLSRALFPFQINSKKACGESSFSYGQIKVGLGVDQKRCLIAFVLFFGTALTLLDNCFSQCS